MGTNYLISNNPNSQKVSRSNNSNQAANLIIEHAKQLVYQLIEDRGHDRPPFSPKEIARMLGINQFVNADLGRTSALLLRFYDGYVIKVNKNHHPVRQNFSIAHEIGHILFNKLKLQNYIKNIEYRTYNTQATQRLRGKAKEQLCDIAATELLMPESVFRKYLSSFGVSINSIEWLANLFKVSIPAAAIRISEVGTEPCVALLWQQQRTKSKALSLAWPKKPMGRNNCTPVHTYVRPPSILHKAYECNSPVKCYKLFKVNNVIKNLTMESKGFGHGEHRYVISLAFLNR